MQQNKILKKISISILILVGIFNISHAQIPSNDVDRCIKIKKNIRFLSRDSSRSNDVTRLQIFLKNEGYLKSQADGVFRVSTRSAVITFQKDNGFGAAAKGNVGPTTRTKIQELTCNNADVTVKPVNTNIITSGQINTAVSTVTVNKVQPYLESYIDYVDSKRDAFVMNWKASSPVGVKLIVDCRPGINIISDQSNGKNICDSNGTVGVWENVDSGSVIIRSKGNVSSFGVGATLGILDKNGEFVKNSNISDGKGRLMMQNEVFVITFPADAAAVASAAINTQVPSVFSNGVESINGIAVPPMPSAPNLNIAGIDTNNNGMRDDVDRALASRTGANSEIYNFAVKSAKNLQLAITSVSATTASRAIFEDTNQQACGSASAKEGAKISNEETLNTRERQGAAVAAYFSGLTAENAVISCQ